MARALLAAWIAVLAFASAPAGAQDGARPERPQTTLAFVGGRWFDGNGFVRTDWYSVGGRLTAVRPDRVDATIDLAGRFVLPPFVEAHNHDVQNAAYAGRSIERNLRQGVFYSIQMCGKPSPRLDFAALLNRPGTLDVQYAGACLSSSDGHPLGMTLASAREAGVEMTVEQAREFYDPVDTEEEVDRLWPEIVGRRPSLIKLILIDSERQAENRADPRQFGFRGLDPELVQPIVARAHAAGIRVAVHIDSAADFGVAVRAGADIIAHLPGLRFAEGRDAAAYRISDEAIAEAARRGTVVVTTAVVARLFMGSAPDRDAMASAVLKDNLSRLRAGGVALAIGSDNVMGTVVDEILYLDGLGVMPRSELLRRATMDSAGAMFPGRSIGRFAEGHEASFIAFDADPTLDPNVLRTPSIRVKQGSLLAP